VLDYPDGAQFGDMQDPGTGGNMAGYPLETGGLSNGFVADPITYAAGSSGSVPDLTGAYAGAGGWPFDPTTLTGLETSNGLGLPETQAWAAGQTWADPSAGLTEPTGFATQEPTESPANWAEPQFGSGGYHGTYNGVPNCWYSSDGYVYGPDGNRIGSA
jgi:hypothetical protein